MYSVPSLKQLASQVEPRQLNGLHYLGWFALTATLSFLSVFLSNWAHTLLISRLGIELDGHDWLEITPVIFGTDPGPVSVLLLAWCVLPALLISTAQSALLVSEHFFKLKALIFIGLSVLIWGAAITIYLKIYPEHEFRWSTPDFKWTAAMAGMFVSVVSLILSTGQWMLLRSAPRIMAWIPSNGLGYAGGWTAGMYVLSQGYKVTELFDGCLLAGCSQR